MKKIVALLLALAMALSMAAAFAETYKIGGTTPLTGAAAVYGVAVYNGASIAAAEITAAGEDTIEYTGLDDQHDAEIAINAYNTLLDAKIQMMLGSTTTAPSLAVSAQAFEDRIFMLTPSASSTQVTEGKDNVFQVCFTDPNQGLASAEYIAANGLPTKVAIIYNNADAYSTGIYQTFEAKAKELGFDIVSVTTFTNDTTDFSTQVADAKNNGAELVFLPIYYQPASTILKQAHDAEYAPVFFGVDGMDGILTMEGFDASLAEGVLLLTPFSADAEDERTQKFVATYKELYNEIPNQFAADAYDGMYALYQAAKVAGITSDTPFDEACDKLIAVFTSPDFVVEGITGTMTWDANGQVSKTPKAVVIQNGVYVGFENAQ